MSLDSAKKIKIDASDYNFLVVASRFNQKLVDALLKDVKATLKEAGSKQIKVIRVPGAAEIPYVCNLYAGTMQYDAIISLGVIIAGETPHHEIIAHSTAKAIQDIALKTAVPVINGIIVTNNLEQAKDRTIGKIKRGQEFANAGIEMAKSAQDFFKYCDID